MPNNPSMVTKQAIELGTISFVQERYRELDIAGDPAELFRQAAHLRERIERHRSRATTAISVGFLILAVGFGVLAFGLRPFTLDLVSFAIIAALVAAGWWLLDFGFRSEQRARYGRHGANQPRYEIESSDIFARVFEPVERGACQLALLSPSGTSTSFTPVSLLPVELYVIKNGFAMRGSQPKCFTSR